jgi:hypothetical protein
MTFAPHAGEGGFLAGGVGNHGECFMNGGQ